MDDTSFELRLTGTDPTPLPAALQAKLKLPGLPLRALTRAQQLEALQRLQDQAERRMKLGAKLFESAQSQVRQQQENLDKHRQEQNALRDEMRQEMARSFRQYDQWVHDSTKDTATRLDEMTAKLGTIETAMAQMQEKVLQQLRRAEALFEQGRYMMEAVEAGVAHAAAPRTEMKAAPTLSSASASAPKLRPTILATTSAMPGAPATPAPDGASLADIYAELLDRLRQQAPPAE